jgi:CRP-like cAMP-binding protein
MSPVDATVLSGNRLLAGLAEQDRRRLAEELSMYEAELREMVYETGEPLRRIVFPLDSVFSLVTTVDQDRLVEVATVGNEGFLGLPTFLQGTFTSGHMAFCQVAGRALSADTARFMELVNGSSGLHAALHRYTLALLTQIAQSSACNRLHSVEQRCMRWILMTHDRVGRDEFLLTQQFLGQMLGVRRASVNEVQRQLQDAGLIRYVRGRVTMLDRAGLEARVCECYRVIRDEHERLSTPPGG